MANPSQPQILTATRHRRDKTPDPQCHIHKKIRPGQPKPTEPFRGQKNHPQPLLLNHTRSNKLTYISTKNILTTHATSYKFLPKTHTIESLIKYYNKIY
jgi:hypothetical protein